MDFASKNGSHHVLIPIGYGEVQKIRKKGVCVHDASTQFAIHTIAQDFPSTLLYIPKCKSLTSHNSYTMEILYDIGPIPDTMWCKDPHLFVELFRFKDFMLQAGYFAKGFRIFTNGQKYILLDFSHFGHVQNGMVRFPGPGKQNYSLFEAESAFGLRYFH